MAQAMASKSRVLTPDELELADALQKAMAQKISAEALLRQARQEIGRLTQEINKFTYNRILVVWGEARDKLGTPSALTQEDVMRR